VVGGGAARTAAGLSAARTRGCGGDRRQLHRPVRRADARAGCSVLVRERGLPGEGASSRNGGMMGDILNPGLSGLAAAHGEAAAHAMWHEARASLDFAKALVVTEAIACGFRPSGCLIGGGLVALSFVHPPQIGQDGRVFRAMCYNGSGVAMAMYCGHKVALKALAIPPGSPRSTGSLARGVVCAASCRRNTSRNPCDEPLRAAWSDLRRLRHQPAHRAQVARSVRCRRRWRPARSVVTPASQPDPAWRRPASGDRGAAPSAENLPSHASPRTTSLAATASRRTGTAARAARANN